MFASGPAQAADFGGDCCADLEERIAELEATTARKGNRKVSLTVSGHVHEGVMFWDDGLESNAYIVNVQNDQSNFSFSGDAAISSDVTAGFIILIRLQNSLSGEVSQDDDDTDLDPLLLWEANWYLESKRLGKGTVGLAPRVSDGAPEQDLSETGLAAYSGVQDIGGGMALRRSSDGTLIDVGWGDIYSHFNGDTANIVRYDTPSFAGFTVSVSWGEDDIWDVGANYEGQVGSFEMAGAIAYTESTDENGAFGDPGEPDYNIVVGSFAIRHQPSGLNALIAAGQQSFDNPVVDADGIVRNVDDPRYIYAKLGWIANFFTLGHTAFYGEYGLFENFVSAGDYGGPGGLVAELDASGGNAVRITGNEADVWGLGVVQRIEAADMDIYIGYRHHTAEFDLVDAAGNSVAAVGIDDFDTVIVGSNINFWVSYSPELRKSGRCRSRWRPNCILICPAMRRSFITSDGLSYSGFHKYVLLKIWDELTGTAHEASSPCARIRPDHRGLRGRSRGRLKTIRAP